MNTNQERDRLTAVEVTLEEHLRACAKTNNRVFAVLMLVAGGVGTLLVKVIWYLP